MSAETAAATAAETAVKAGAAFDDRRRRRNLAELSRLVHAGGAERRRDRLVTVASAGLVTMLLAAVDLLGPWLDTAPGWGGSCRPAHGGACVTVRATSTESLVSYVREPGTRVGVVLAAVLLAVPFAVLGVQVLRLGTAARERRLAALSVAGATRADLRRMVARAAARPALLGAVAGLHAVVVLWLALGVLPPPGARLLPAPTWPVLVTWPCLALVVVAAAAGSAASAASATTARGGNPVGESRRVVRPLGPWSRLMPVVFLVAVLAGLVDLVARGPGLLALALPVSVIGAAVSLGPWLVLLAGHRYGRSRSVVTVLAGRRLVADPRTPGRVAGVLFAVGLAVGIAVTWAGVTMDEFRGSGRGFDDLGYYLGGDGLALAAIGFAGTVAAASLVVGANESVLDARRPTAALVAMGARPSELQAVLHRQLWATAWVPSVAGAVLGWLLWFGLVAGTVVANGLASGIGGFVSLPIAVGITALTARLGVAIAVRLVRGTLHEAVDPANLRTA